MSSSQTTATSSASSSTSMTNREQVEFFLALGERMKRIERESHVSLSATHELVVRSGVPMMARLDGHCFATFTQGICRPFDRRLAAAMRRTAADLLAEFHAVTAYTHSDEITLFWMPKFDEKTGAAVPWLFNGRVHKLNSLLASFCSVRFNFHIQTLFADVLPDVDVDNTFAAGSLYDGEDAIAAGVAAADAAVGLPPRTLQYNERTLAKLRGANAIFDSRLFSLDDVSLAVDCLVWRQQHDCKRNSIHGLARSVFSTKELHACSVPRMHQMLRARNINYAAMDAQFRQGVFVKRRLVTIDAVDHKTGEAVTTTRARCTFVDCALPSWGADAGALSAVQQWLAAKSVDSNVSPTTSAQQREDEFVFAEQDQQE
jgi:tRNA(His) guanylyltransferase